MYDNFRKGKFAKAGKDVIMYYPEYRYCCLYTSAWNCWILLRNSTLLYNQKDELACR